MWSKETKEYAYQLWAYICGRNAGAVARRLREENMLPREMPHVRVQETVAHWAKKYEWRLRIKSDFKVIAPDLHDMIAQEVILGARESVEYLRKVVGEPGKHDANRVRAALALMDRAGFTPIRHRDPVVFDPQVMSDEEVTAYTLTPEDIFALQARAGIVEGRPDDAPEEEDYDSWDEDDEL